MLAFQSNNIDLNKAVNELLFGEGAIIIKNVYPNDKIDEARTIVNHFADQQNKNNLNLSQRVWNLFGKGKIFSDLITNDIIFDLMSKFLGKDFICGSYAASRLLPGASGQDLHIDYPFGDYKDEKKYPINSNSSFPQNCQVTIPLEIFSKESGATKFCPGSQKKLHFPNQNDDASNFKQMLASPGDLVFFYGMVWHGAMPNKSNHNRTGLLIELLPGYIKPLENFIEYLDKDFLDNSQSRIKQLLGITYPYPIKGEEVNVFK